MRSFIKNIRTFYRDDCCWPYAASFFLTPVIYWVDFFVTNARIHWASPVAYGILFAYFLYILLLYSQNKLEKKNTLFFIGFLSLEVIALGIVLFLLYAIT